MFALVLVSIMGITIGFAFTRATWIANERDQADQGKRDAEEALRIEKETNGVRLSKLEKRVGKILAGVQKKPAKKKASKKTATKPAAPVKPAPKKAGKKAATKSKADRKAEPDGASNATSGNSAASLSPTGT